MFSLIGIMQQSQVLPEPHGLIG